MLARFISADSIIPGQRDTAGTANPQHLNRYAYVENNPIKNTDPSGHDATDGAEGPVGPIDGAGGGSGLGAPVPVPPVREVQGDAELRGMTVESDGSTRPIGQSQEEAELTGRTGSEGEQSNAPTSHGSVEQAEGVTGYAPDRILPRTPGGEPMPESEYAHTQLGIQNSDRTGKYRQTREFDANGRVVRDTDWTDHRRPDVHTNPHDHYYEPNATGGSLRRGPGQPKTDLGE